MLDAEVALVRALAVVGLAPSSAVGDVASAADRIRFDISDLALRARSTGNPVPAVVADLIAQTAQASADHIHQGATSQDIMDTAMMLVAARTLDLVIADLDHVVAGLAAIARAHRDTPMVGRTLTQHAVPITFGLKAAGWRSVALDARDRIAVVCRSLPAQLGGAAGTLAAVRAYAPTAPTDLGARLVTVYSETLGLSTPTLPWHTLRTPIADLGAALAFTAGALGKIAADVLVLSRTEIGEVNEGVGGGSSAMPHKANPVLSTMIVATSRQLPALAAILVAALVAEDERASGPWHAEWQTLREALRLTGGAAHAAAGLVDGLVVHPDRMRSNLDLTHGLILSEHAYVDLATRMPAKAARTIVDDASKLAVSSQISLKEAMRSVEGAPSGSMVTDPAGYLGFAAELTDIALERQAAQ
jgi:3-carboxy-cis,cis-muconate cycloisomerase